MLETSAYVVNEMDRRLMGINGMNPFDVMDSSPRKNMFASHIGQCLVIKEGSERFIQTGMERQYAQTTFSVKMPENGTILKVIPRYQEEMGDERIQNPETILIYEGDETGEIGLIRLPGYFSDQTYFGFEYKAKKITNSIRQFSKIARGTILLDSPAVTENGDYKYGRELNTMFASLPGVSEDGIIVCRDVLPYFAINTFERRDAEWGSRYIPINLYPDPNNPGSYQPFPNIGDMVRDDGLLLCLRRDDRNMAISQQSARALREVNYFDDRRVYAEGKGGRVKDIKIYHDDYANSNAPEAMERQAMRYHRSTQRFYREVLDVIKGIEKRRGGYENFVVSKPLHALAVEAEAMLDNRANGSQERRVLLHRKNPLDTWRVEFVIQYERVPDIGWKWTDCHGGKGVIVEILERHQMPVDEHGNSADVIMDGGSTNSRMNLGRLQEQYMNSASRDVRRRLCQMLSVDRKTPAMLTQLEQLKGANPQLIEEAWLYLMGYLKIISEERMYQWWQHGWYVPPLGLPKDWVDKPDCKWDGEKLVNLHPKLQYLADVLSYPDPNGILLYFPPEHRVELPDIVRQCEAAPEYRPLFGPVTYIGNSGNKSKTVNNFRIGSLYFIQLEKIADDWTAVPSSKRQHFGVISQVTSWDKHSTPQRQNAIRAWGESEIRISVSFAGARVTADILDRNNSPQTARHIYYKLLRATKPTDIEEVVDRKLVPYGGNKPLQLFKHMAECGGWGLEFKPYVAPIYQPVQAEVTFTSVEVDEMSYALPEEELPMIDLNALGEEAPPGDMIEEEEEDEV